MNAITRLIDKAKTADDSGYTVLMNLFGVSRQAVHKFEQQGWLPVDRATAAASKFDIPVRDLVRADVRAAMDHQTAQSAT